MNNRGKVINVTVSFGIYLYSEQAEIIFNITITIRLLIYSLQL